MRTNRGLVAGAALLAMIAACQATPPKQTTSSGMVKQIVLPPGAPTGLVANFNPFAPTYLLTQYMYEPLYAYDSYHCSPVPWLATAYKWENPKTLTFTIRKGVKWSDGKPFGPKDVAFTFNMLKAHPAMDTNGLWQQLAGVQAHGNQVTFTFQTAAGPIFTELVGIPIVAQHIWSTVKNVEKFTNPHPVVTGPYLLKSVNNQQVVLKRNTSYWQADKVKVEQLVDKAGSTGDVETLQHARGEIDWGAQFIPDIQTTVVAKDPKHNKYWFPPGGSISLYLNLTEAPFNDLAFRKALTYAVDKERIAKQAEYGYVTTASQTALTLPGQKSWLAPDIANNGRIPYNPATAKKQLAAAGYKTDKNGHLLGKDGKQISVKFEVQAGYSDWIAAAQVVKQDLQNLGMKVDVRTISPDTVTNDMNNGKFDAAFGVAGGGCDMYQNYNGPLSSKNTAPIGKPATSNQIRWKDPKTDALLAKLRSTPKVADQKKIVHQLEHIMVDKVPFIPLWYGAHWFEYSTKNAVGWPDADHPYAIPNNGSDQLPIITRLRAAG